MNSVMMSPGQSATQAMPGITHSVVIPFYNESGNAVPLLHELCEVENQLGALWEYILVDDCSTDDTLNELVAWASGRKHTHIYQTPRNMGQASSLYAGLFAASGPVIITLDGDGQNVPADIPSLLPLLEQVDMVVGIRAKRRDSWSRRRMSRFANRIRSKVLGDGMQDSGCALKVFHQRVRYALLPIKTLYSFMPAMAVAGGFSVAQQPVQHRLRTRGQSSYGLRAFAWRPLVDMVGLWWFARRSLKAAALAHSASPFCPLRRVHNVR